LPTKPITRLLDQLDEAKRRFGGREQSTLTKTLSQLQRRKFTDAESLIRFHEILLFIRAYPPSARILRLVEKILASFINRVNALRDSNADLSPLGDPEVSGIAGTSVTDTFSYYIVRWLSRKHPAQIEFDWDWFEDENRLAETLPRFLPLLEEDALVEANVPYLNWIHAAKADRERDVQWLVKRFELLSKSDRERAELYDSLKLYTRWTPSYRATRTGMKLSVPNIFYHRQPLIRRRDVSLREELQSFPPPLRRLSAKQGEAILDMIRETSTLRYRELYGFTHGDPQRVFKVAVGRGVELFVIGVPAGKRLPLRAYHAAMIFKNGVPVGYFEGLSLFERMESGFNFYYSFREGETAWIYARTLNVFHHLLGVTAFSVDPYQIGFENEEGIESGAFWFYRKLGFRPTQPKLVDLALAEEKKIAARTSYRTPAKVLRRLAEGPMIFELDESKTGDWDRFRIRNIGLAVQRRMAARFRGNAEKIRIESVKAITRLLNFSSRGWNELELNAVSDLALVLALISDLSDWTRQDQQLLENIIRSKASRVEARYLKQMQKHARLRSEIIRLGSQ
jgi:hypothetical protein